LGLVAVRWYMDAFCSLMEILVCWEILVCNGIMCGIY
jgi:hypothetical protein